MKNLFFIVWFWHAVEILEVGVKFSLKEKIFPKIVSSRQAGFIKLRSSFVDIDIPVDFFKFCKWIELGQNHEL